MNTDKINLRLSRNAVRCGPFLKQVLTSKIRILVPCKEIWEAIKYAIKVSDLSSFFKITDDEIVYVPNGSAFCFTREAKESKESIVQWLI
jgi:hypothetical protein